MIKERDKYENFENYLKGKFDGSQKTEFEKLLSTDADLLKQFEEYKEAHQLIFDSSLLDIKKQLSDINNRALSQHRVWQNIKYTIYGVSIIATVYVIYLVLHKNTTTEKQPANISQPIITPKDTFIKTDSLKKNIPSSPTLYKKVQNTPVKKQEVLDNTQKTGPILNNPNLDTTNKTNHITKSTDSVTIKPSKTGNVGNVKGSKDQKPEDNKYIDCSKLKISCNYKIEDACIGSSLGKILFDLRSIKGGKAPYMFSIDNEATFTFNYNFEDLDKGPYTLFIKDVNDCSTNLGIANVKEIACDNDFAFAPERGDVWEIPFDKDKTGKLYIYTKAGNLVYTSDLGPYSSQTWDGKATDGKTLPMNAYVFKIVYTNGEFFNGTVTIIK